VLGNEFVEHPGSVIGIANVGLMPRCLPAKRFNRSDGLIRLIVTHNVVDANIGSVFGKQLRNAGPNTTAGTSDKRLFTFKKFCGHGFIDPF
jgi:hypothetical protein